MYYLGYMGQFAKEVYIGLKDPKRSIMFFVPAPLLTLLIALCGDLIIRLIRIFIIL